MEQTSVVAVRAVAADREPVPGRTALTRAITGIGLGTAFIALLGLAWPDALAYAPVTLALGAVQWLHEPTDRRSGAAVAAGGATVVIVSVGSAVVLQAVDTSLARAVACVALGAIAGSQVYAAVTRLPHPLRQREKSVA
jgi:hypothetical protein